VQQVVVYRSGQITLARISVCTMTWSPSISSLG
jgi:hypothetical protein